MRNFRFLGLAALIASTSVCFASPQNPSVSGNTAQGVSEFSVAKQTEVPGAVLKPGSYSIRVVDHLSDRVILQVEDSNGKILTTFLGLPDATLQSASQGPVAWNAGPKGEDALRGFSFPDGAVEFVYRKEEAVAIAKVNADKVPAIDPASQGLTSAADGAKLSKADMQILTLWLLSTTTVGAPNDTQPAIQAERYQAPPATQIASAESSQTAAPQSVSPQSQPQSQPQPQPQPQVARAHARRQAPPASQQIASLKAPAALKALPHTASELPAIFLLGMMALFAAGALRLVRRSGDES